MRIEQNNNELNGKLPEEGANDFTGGFCVPGNYFEMLESNIQEKVSRIPILCTVKSENPFTVPEQYFTELENSVREKISLETERSTSASLLPSYWRTRLVPVMAMILVIAVCAVTFIVLNRNNISEKDISFN